MINHFDSFIFELYTIFRTLWCKNLENQSVKPLISSRPNLCTFCMMMFMIRSWCFQPFIIDLELVWSCCGCEIQRWTFFEFSDFTPDLASLIPWKPLIFWGWFFLYVKLCCLRFLCMGHTPKTMIIRAHSDPPKLISQFVKFWETN